MFEQLFAKLMDPTFAATAANVMDPSTLLAELGQGIPTASGSTVVQPSFSEIVNGQVATPPINPVGAPTPTPATPKALALDPKYAAALQALTPKPVDNTPRAPSAGVMQATMRPQFTPLAVPEQARQSQRPSLAQLIYGR